MREQVTAAIVGTLIWFAAAILVSVAILAAGIAQDHADFDFDATHAQAEREVREQANLPEWSDWLAEQEGGE